MKISLKLANGSTLEFEGEQEEFEQIQAFLAEPPAAFTANVPKSHSATAGEGDPDEPNGEAEGEGDNDSPLSPRSVMVALERVGADTDLERVTVMAYQASLVTDEGIDYPTVDQLYTDLGLKKPPRYPKAFSNAKLAGLVKNAGYGRWLPTVQGENYAKGFGRAGTRRRSGRGQVSPNGGGGETD